MSPMATRVLSAALSRRRCRALALAALALVAMLTVLTYMARVPDGQPEAVELWGHKIPPMCLFRRLTGRPCPGCGITRAVILAVHGRIKQSLEVHPSGVWVCAWLGVQLLVRMSLAICPFRRWSAWLLDGALSMTALAAAIYVPMLHSGLPT